MPFSILTTVLTAGISGVCFTLGWTARRVSTSGREVELKRNVYEAKGAIPQLESNLRNRDQRINMLQSEAQSLRDRLMQVESAASLKDAEIVKRDREIRLIRSELQIVKDGSVGAEIGPTMLDETEVQATPATGADPKLAADFKKLEGRYESLKRGLVQRDDRIAALETELQGDSGKRSTRVIEQELEEQRAAAEAAQSVLAARDATIRELQIRLEQDVEQRELLETLTKRRGDTNRTLKDNYAKLEAQLPKLMEQLNARGTVIAEREASIAVLDADLAQVRTEKAERDATIVRLEAELAKGRAQAAQQAANHLAQKQHLHELEQRINMLTREVAETGKALQAAHALVRERDAAIVARDGRVQAIETKLREQGNTVAALQKTIKDRDFKISGLVADMADLEAKQLAHSQALQLDLSKSEERAGMLSAALAESANAAQTAPVTPHEQGATDPERDAHLRDAEARLLEDANNTIASLRRALAARNDELDTLTADSAALRAQLAQSAERVHSAASVEAVEPVLLTAESVDQSGPSDAASQTPRDSKVLRSKLTELESRCTSLTDLVRSKDATLTERARRIEDLQEQLQRIEARVDERNQQIAELKRRSEETSAYAAARNTSPAYTSHPKPQ